jgi:hypothetical protein
MSFVNSQLTTAGKNLSRLARNLQFPPKEIVRKRAANDALFGANWFVVEMPVAILAGHFRYGTTFTSRLAGAD